jgi:hypothetical protein
MVLLLLHEPVVDMISPSREDRGDGGMREGWIKLKLININDILIIKMILK